MDTAETSPTPSAWCYLHVPRSSAHVGEALAEHFPTFVHTNIVYHRGERGIRHEERPTIAGLLFVQSEPKAVQAFLRERSTDVYLARDCATGQTAIIPDSVMQAFMRTTQIEPTRIRFLHHALDYYAEGHHLVRIVSGPLAGFEGYVVRIARDRCLVTSLGGITISIAGIHRDPTEEL